MKGSTFINTQNLNTVFFILTVLVVFFIFSGVAHAQECNDGFDNDGDGFIDYNGGSGDVGCYEDADNSELDLPACALNPAMYDQIVHFDPLDRPLVASTQFLIDEATNGPEPFILAAGNYEVSVHTWDNNADRDLVPPQLIESSYLEFFQGGLVHSVSSASVDVPDSVVVGEWVGVVDAILNLPSATDEIRARHVAWPLPIGEPWHSHWMICAGFNSVPPPAIEVTTLNPLDLGVTEIGNTLSGLIQIKNIGAGTLIGTPGGFTNPEYSCVSPNCSAEYNLAADETVTFTVEYIPVDVGTDSDTITFPGGGGATVTVDAEGTALPPPLPTVDLAPATQTITAGDSVLLTWTSTDADPTGCTITDSTGLGPYTNLNANDSRPFSPIVDTTYTIICSNSTGSTVPDPDTAVITVNPLNPACNDGIDNDGDGLIDRAGGDPGCHFATDQREEDLPVCIFNPASYDEIIYFDPADTAVRADINLDRATNGPIATALPAGTYEVSLHAYDDGFTRDTADPQLVERYFIELYDGGIVHTVSAATPDLQDYQTTATWSGIVNIDLDVSQPIDEVRARHFDYPNGALPIEPSSLFPICAALKIVPPTPTECSDGIDNDGDGDIDWPADTGCAGALDDDEGRQCSDGIDNDGDGFTDVGSDPGCDHISDKSEVDPPACAFNPAAYDEVVSFDISDRVLNPTGLLDRAISGPEPLVLPAGTYEVYLHSFDDGPDRDIEEPQLNEQYFVELSQAGLVHTVSAASADVPDFLNYAEWSGVVNNSLDIATPVDEITAKHLSYPGTETGSVRPICAAFKDTSFIPPVGPVINDFNVTTVADYGTESTIDWNVSGPIGTTCTLDGPGGLVALPDLVGNDLSIPLFDNGVFTLECDDGAGGTDSDSKTTFVRPSVNVWLTNLANPQFGLDTTHVMWNVLGPAVSCAATGFVDWQATGAQPPGGGVDQGPVGPFGPFFADTTFTLTCQNVNGDTGQDSESLDPRPFIQIFDGVSPIVQGTNSTLNWEVQGVGLTVSGETVSGDDGGWDDGGGGSKGAVNSQSVGPINSQSIYRIIAENGSGDIVTDEVVIDVLLPKAIINVIPNTQILKRKSATIEWVTENIDPGTCELEDPINGLQDPVADIDTYDTGALTGPTTYILRCDLLAAGGGTFDTPITVETFIPEFFED